MSLPTPHELASRLNGDHAAADVRAVIDFLKDQGTFRVPTLSTGLFSASAALGDDFAQTGYHNVWVRDSVHIAHALWKTDQPGQAVRAIEALMTYFQQHQRRFADVIEGRTDPRDPMQRPHIRFDGDHLTELPEKWAHAQNDALGAFLWLYCAMIASGDIRPAPAAWSVLADFPAFFRSVRFWEDEDSGHWEETRKIAASSIGVATAGLRQLRLLMGDAKCEWALGRHGRGVGTWEVDWLIQQGEGALATILPAECVQSDLTKHRRFDAALLFLIYPFTMLDDAVADVVVRDVRTHLMGPIGVRRYLGDSYWCADYKDLLAADQRTADFSDDLSRRDRLLQPGLEAQWCIFDPILAVIFARRFTQHRDPADRRLHVEHLQRSLRQLTPADSPHGPYHCPESYYCCHGEWVPNDITPLLWTQANLRLALLHAQQVLD